MRVRAAGVTGRGAAPWFVAGALLLQLAAAPAAAVVPDDQRDGAPAQEGAWLAWVGCWAPVEGSEATEEGEAQPDLVCVRLLEGERGARISTVRDGAVVSERILRTDGARHAVEVSGCKGWEEATWSEDGRRLYLRSEMECGDAVDRETSGVFALSEEGHWLDVQAVRVGGREDAGVGTRRFAPASAEQVREMGLPPFPTERELAARTARIHASAPLGLDGVVEASSHVDPAALQVLLVETESRFELSGDRLLALRDAGVPDDVIDVVVAVSFPERFQVDAAHRVAERVPETTRTRRPSRYGYRTNPFRPGRYGGLYRSLYYDPFFYDPFFHSGVYFRTTYRSPYRSPIVVVPVGPQPRSPLARVIQGRGYTRGGSADRSTSSSSGNDRPRTAPSSRDRGNDSGSREPSRVSPQGHSGSSGKDTGRTARPKGGSDDDGGGGVR